MLKNNVVPLSHTFCLETTKTSTNPTLNYPSQCHIKVGVSLVLLYIESRPRVAELVVKTQFPVILMAGSSAFSAPCIKPARVEAGNLTLMSPALGLAPVLLMLKQLLRPVINM